MHFYNINIQFLFYTTVKIQAIKYCFNRFMVIKINVYTLKEHYANIYVRAIAFAFIKILKLFIGNCLLIILSVTSKQVIHSDATHFACFVVVSLSLLVYK